MFNSWPERIFSLCFSLRLQVLCHGSPGCEAVFPRRAVLCPGAASAGAGGRNEPLPELVLLCHPAVPCLLCYYCVDNAVLGVLLSCQALLLLGMFLPCPEPSSLGGEELLQMCLFSKLCCEFGRAQINSALEQGQQPPPDAEHTAPRSCFYQFGSFRDGMAGDVEMIGMCSAKG